MTKAHCWYFPRFFQFSYHLVAIWIVASLTSCNALPGYFPSNTHQSGQGSVVIIDSTPFVTPALTSDVKFASFDPTSTASTMVTGTPQPGSLSKPLTTSAPSPLKTSDLYFLADDKLMRWDHVTNFMVPLAENVISFSIDSTGRRVALLRSTRITANGIALYNLDLLDLDAKQTTTLLKGIPRLKRVLISPNSRWIAFQEGDLQPTLYAISINEPGQWKQIGFCNKTTTSYCETASWSPDSNSLIWEDESGIWVSDLAKSKPTLVTPHVYDVTDPEGQKSQIAITFQGLEWSPNGRYVLSHIKTEANVCWFAILDTRQGHWFEIPGTFQMSTPQTASASWMKDGKILVVNIVNQRESPNALIDIWQVVSTRNELLVLERNFPLYNLRFPATSQSSLDEIKFTAEWSDQIQDQVISFVISSADTSHELILYWVDIEQETPLFVNQAQITASEVIWAPDSSGALLIDGSTQSVFVPSDGSQPIQLTEAIGQKAHDFVWAPPAPRL